MYNTRNGTARRGPSRTRELSDNEPDGDPDLTGGPDVGEDRITS